MQWDIEELKDCMLLLPESKTGDSNFILPPFNSKDPGLFDVNLQSHRNSENFSFAGGNNSAKYNTDK
jgi:hypothetical protein